MSNFSFLPRYDIHMRDLESALSFIFTREIVIKKILHKENLERFVGLLVQCFPARPAVNRFLKILHKWLQGIVKDKDRPLRPSALRLFYNMHKADNTSLPENVEWRTCQGSRPQYRGYPCSLWILFHTLTVNCATRGITSLTGADVLARIRGYVKSFFSCLECSKHFYNMSKNVEKEVHTHNEAILWLWRAHNKVNKRLSKEPSTDPHFPKIAYPPKDLCIECSDDRKGHNNTWNDSPSTWRDNVVLNYLKVHYSVHNIRLSESEETPEPDRVRYISGNEFVRVIGFGMTYFDTSLCVIVYGTGVVILVMLYIYILRRRRRGVKHFSHMA
ncbi:sulfhydryl oxidase 1-like [Paramuricea clavata]|uniref:Sulfhydryl oxidase n=1 Tax=Paramuricea clavata TaxID=317549 RepID=A0A6S7KP45_PARCT|nr:sulfhydryl oxidase 1-like [Paramuricea clavata]